MEKYRNIVLVKWEGKQIFDVLKKVILNKFCCFFKEKKLTEIN